MNNQRDAILGYTDESPDSEAAESIMTTLFLKKSFWLNGSEFQNVVQGLQPL